MMKRFFVLLVFVSAILCNLSARVCGNQLSSTYPYSLRISLLKSPGSSYNAVKVQLYSPLTGTLSNVQNESTNTSQSIVGNPLTIAPNMVMLSFQISGALQYKNRTIHISNSCGYDIDMNVDPIDTVQETVPLNPNGDTVITITVTD